MGRCTPPAGFFEIVLGNVGEEFADNLEGVFAVFCGKVAYAALLRVNRSTAECFLSNIFSGNCLHYLRAGKEHVRDALCHDVKSVRAGE